MKLLNEIINILLKVVAIFSLMYCSLYFSYYTQNGRFQNTDNEVIDTRTGAVYLIDESEGDEFEGFKQRIFKKSIVKP